MAGERSALADGQKKEWHWECKQRTDKVHTGVRMQLFLDIPSAGEYEIAISMREDGAELDKFLLVMDKTYRPPGVAKDSAKAAPEAKPKKTVRNMTSTTSGATRSGGI